MRVQANACGLAASRFPRGGCGLRLCSAGLYGRAQRTLEINPGATNLARRAPGAVWRY